MEHHCAVKGIDFVECLESDMSVYIMSFLDDPSDLARACAVSSFWREFIITKGLTKQLCVKTYPQFANVVETVVVSKPKENSVGTKTEWEILKRDHKVYAALHWAVLKTNRPLRDCVLMAVSASSNDRLPGVRSAVRESSSDRYPYISLNSTVKGKGSLLGEYWSSKGQSDPTVPETLIYRLSAGLWVITEIDIAPFKARYSAKSVRFRLGHLRPLSETGVSDLSMDGSASASDKFRWTYTSPEFPMLQKDGSQRFKLPEPVLCVDGYLQIELLGRVQRHELDGLFYLCVQHVSALGRSLHTVFLVKVREPYGLKNIVLNYVPEDLPYLLQSTPHLDIIHLRLTMLHKAKMVETRERRARSFIKL